MRHIAWAFCAGIVVAGCAAAARADPVTYTWQTASSINGNGRPATPLSLSFTVDGPVSVEANSGFADNAQGIPPATQVAYRFPAGLSSFDLHVGDLTITLADFVSSEAPNGTGSGFIGLPQWTFDLTADPTTETASLSLSFINDIDSDQISGATGTGALGGFTYRSDDGGTGCFSRPCTYSGTLGATRAVPEPPSLRILLGAIATLALSRWARVRRRVCTLQN
jgi:hypothetical protein